MKSQADKFFDQAPLWQAELRELRTVLRECGLTEEIKWGKPCYSHDGKNIAILQPMKEHLALMFFKGELMKDPKKVMQSVGPNSRSGRRILFTSVTEVLQQKRVLKALIKEAVAVEKAGMKVAKPPELTLVEELKAKLARDRKLAAAFLSLTPGRQREYNLYFAGAKQSSTRASRIEKYVDKIRAGKGLRE